MQAGFAAAEKIDDHDVTATVAFNDYVAFGLLSGLQARGVRVPEDMSLAGFDDIPFATYVSPGITTVRRPVVRLGGDVWHTLNAMINGAAAQKPTALRSQIVVRASTGAPRTPPEKAS
jgi:LacI family transcriptional regulator